MRIISDREAYDTMKLISDYCVQHKNCKGCIFHKGICLLNEVAPQNYVKLMLLDRLKKKENSDD